MSTCEPSSASKGPQSIRSRCSSRVRARWRASRCPLDGNSLILRCGLSAPLEKRAERQAKHVGNFVQPAATTPVYALLVFLRLLEGDSDALCQVGLAQAFIDPINSDVPADEASMSLGFPL